MTSSDNCWAPILRGVFGNVLAFGATLRGRDLVLRGVLRLTDRFGVLRLGVLRLEVFARDFEPLRRRVLRFEPTVRLDFLGVLRLVLVDRFDAVRFTDLGVRLLRLGLGLDFGLDRVFARRFGGILFVRVHNHAIY